jgi:hypothetical protein
LHAIGLAVLVYISFPFAASALAVLSIFTALAGAALVFLGCGHLPPA